MPVTMTLEERLKRKAEAEQRFRASHARNAALTAGMTEGDLMQEICEEVSQYRRERLSPTELRARRHRHVRHGERPVGTGREQTRF